LKWRSQLIRRLDGKGDTVHRDRGIIIRWRRCVVKKKSIVAVLSLILVVALAVTMVTFHIPQRVFGDQPQQTNVVPGQPVSGGPPIPQLTEDEKAKAKEIALADPRLQEVLQGTVWAIAPDGIGVWHTSADNGLQKIGAVLKIDFAQPYQISYNWPFITDSEDSSGSLSYNETTIYESFPVKILTILVDLRTEKVVMIAPMMDHSGLS
jgi:hypothetical protein